MLVLEIALLAPTLKADLLEISRVLWPVIYNTDLMSQASYYYQLTPMCSKYLVSKKPVLSIR